MLWHWFVVVFTAVFGHLSRGQSANSTSGCRLPQDAPHSRYCPVQCQKCFGGGGACHLAAGSSVQLTVVRASCAPGHRLQVDQESVLVACDKGKWIGGEFPQCLAQCPPLESDSVFVRCDYNGRQVDCGSPAMPLTTASVQCRPSHTEYASLAKDGVYSRKIACRYDGKWSYSLPECKPVCGVSKGSAIVEPTVVDGKATPLGVFPWHAGIYLRDGQGWKYICGGSLITKRVVLTAAHCVIEDKKKLQIAFAKIYRAWEKDESHTVKRNVSDIRIPREFDYGVNSLAWDIALLLLSQPVQINSYVMPVCRDVTFTLEFSQNVTGYVVGWGKTSETGNNSDVLQHNDVAIQHHDECSKKIPKVLAVDKFCGSKNKGSVVQKGDSGGGLTAALNNQHFVVGIVSVRFDDISIFTNTSWSPHASWVDNEINNFDQDISKCHKGTFQCGVYGACLKKSVRCDGHRDCPDGTDEQGCTNADTDVSFRPLEQPSEYPGGCRLPPQPDHGEYYSSGCMPGDTRPACTNEPGTSVTPRWYIKYSCHEGYVSSSPIFIEYSTCINATWKNPIDCIKLCPPLKSQTRHLTCSEGGFEVSCEETSRPGTTVTASCKRLSFDPVNSDRPATLTCLDSGKWSPPLRECTTECGVSNNDSNGGLSFGTPAKLDDFPWTAAVFKKNTELKWKQQCTGTLITTRLVITAAPCLKTANGRVLQPEDVKVGVGKNFRDIEATESYSVISNARRIAVTTMLTGQGGAKTSSSGVGLVALDVTLDVKPYIMPACVSWVQPFEVNHGYVGHLATWDATGGALRSTKMTYVDRDICRRKDALYSHVTVDTFCANNANGSELDLGLDAAEGAGLTLTKDGRHFVIGVLMRVAPEGGTHVFTDIADPRYLSWISEKRTEFDGDHNSTDVTHTDSKAV